MRNLKKFLALVLAMLMVVSASATVSAFDDVDEDSQYAEAIEDLVEKGIITGFSSDEFKPDAQVTRWQFALMLVKGYTGITDSSDWENGVPLFDDIEAGQYVGAIGKAVGAGIIKGRSATTFDPAATVNYSEALTMAVRALGFETTDKDGVVNMTYPTDYLAKAMELGLTDNISITDKYQPLTRAETAQIIYNLIYAERYVATGETAKPTFAEQNFDEVGVSNVTTFVVTSTVKQSLADITDPVDEDDEAVALTKIDENGNFAANPIYVTCEALGIDVDDIEDYIGITVELVNYNAKKGTFAKAIFGETSEVYNTAVTVYSPSTSYTKIKINSKTYYVVDEYTGDTIKNEILLFNGADKLSAVDFNDVTLLAGNYKLVLYDNDKDGIADRAVYYPIYVSVFNKIDTDLDDLTAGAWGTSYDVENTYVLPEDVDLSKGDVFTYTYNFETDTVYVMDVIGTKSGVLQKVDGTKKDSASDKYVVKLTIDGVVYTLDNDDREDIGLTVGNLKSTTFKSYQYISGKDSSGNAVTPSIGYADYDTIKNLVGKNVTFYVNDSNEIIYAYQTPSVSLTTTYAVISKAVTYDMSAIYVNMYINGALTKNVEVVKIGDKKVSSYTTDEDIFGYAELTELFKAGEDYAPGTIVKATKNTDGTYNISTDISSLETYAGGIDIPNVKFKSGIGDQTDNLAIADKDMIRSNANTIFYFVNTDTKDVTLFVGKPADGDKIVMVDGVKIYADKLGYGSAAPKAGEASVVIVTYTTATKANISGFGGAVNSVPDTDIVFVASGLTLADDTMVLGSELGFTGDDASTAYYVYTNDNLAINMETGAVVKTIYSETTITAGKFYKINSSAVNVGDGSTGITTLTLGGDAAFTSGRYWTVAGVAGTISSVYVTYDNAISIKTSESDIDTLVKDGVYTAAYLKTSEKVVVVVRKAEIQVKLSGIANGNTDIEVVFGATTKTSTVSVTDDNLTYTLKDADVLVEAVDKVSVTIGGKPYVGVLTNGVYVITGPIV